MEGVRWALFALALGCAVRTIVRAWRARREASPYVLDRWDAGFLLEGRVVKPNIMLAVGIAEIAFILAVATGLPATLGLFKLHEQLTYRAPTGWVDLSERAGPANFEDVPPEVKAMARDHSFSALAIDRRCPDASASFALFSAMAISGTVSISDAGLSDVYRKVFSHSPEGTHALKEKGFPLIAGQKVGRFVAEIRSADAVSGEMTVYVVPGRGQYSVITYTIPIASVSMYAQSISDSIEATVASGKRE